MACCICGWLSYSFLSLQRCMIQIISFHTHHNFSLFPLIKRQNAGKNIRTNIIVYIIYHTWNNDDFYFALQILKQWSYHDGFRLWVIYIVFSIKNIKKIAWIIYSIFGVKKFYSLRSEFHSILTPEEWKFPIQRVESRPVHSIFTPKEVITEITPREWRQWPIEWKFTKFFREWVITQRKFVVYIHKWTWFTTNLKSYNSYWQETLFDTGLTKISCLRCVIEWFLLYTFSLFNLCT